MNGNKVQKFLCNPLSCLSINVVMWSAVLGVFIVGYVNIDGKITKLYEILLNKDNKIILQAQARQM